MDVKEKLVEILGEFLLWPSKMKNVWMPQGIEKLADHLISHGITVQEWISVTERLTESGKESALIALRWGEVDIGLCEEGRWRSEFVNEYEEGEVTHWMPLPNPPKGVNDAESVD